MRAEIIKQTIIDLWDIKRPINLTGKPGGGKTSVVKQAAQQLGVDYIHKHGPSMLVEDFGVPDMTAGDDNFTYKMPPWWPSDPETEAILCFDDRGQCSSDIQKVIANIQEERELHGHPLPKGVMIVSTGNRVEDRAGANRTLSHLADRETELEFDTMLDDWTRWAIAEDVHPSVISFVRFRPNLLHDFDPQRPKNPTPRSWVKGVSAILDKVQPEAEYDCFKGAVGEGASAEFVGFRKIERALPNIDNLLMHPDKFEVPTDPATLYAISGAIAHKATTTNFDRVIQVANQMPQEFGVLTVSYAARRDPELASTQAFTTWAVANTDVLF
tara:strand:- start:1802 stop:2785 length:984 start_codon:yes stop_codon:yes gene_type:complete